MIDQTQNRIRTVLLGATLVVTAGLTVLSIVGSFIGPERARTAVNGPLVWLWIFLAAFLMAGIVWSANILRRWASLCMHSGVVLVLIGSMYNSPAGHAMAGRIMGAAKPAHGYMQIVKGHSSGVLFDEDGKPIAQLPFDLQLKDFSVEYYPSVEGPWQLWAVWPDDQVQLAWKAGQDVAIGTTGVTLRVEEYLPHAKPTYAQPATTTAAGRTASQAERLIGAEADAPGGLPAMRFSVARKDGGHGRAWLVAVPDKPMAAIGLEDLLGPGAGSDVGIYLVKPDAPVRSYRSDIEVVEGDKVMKTASVEVNHPLHYGGYDFTQNSYDMQGGRYTILAATSDTGLWVVYAGMAMVGLGAAGSCWLMPAIAYFRRKGPPAGEGV